MAELIKRQEDHLDVKQAANLLGHAVNSLRERRFNYDNPGIHPMLRAGLNFGLHQYGRCLQILLGYKTEGLSLLVNSALYEMKFYGNHSKLEEIIHQDASKEPSLTDVIYSKAPNPTKERFKLRRPETKGNPISDAYRSLTKKDNPMIEATLEQFERVFGAGEFNTKVTWISTNAHLRYFVNQLGSKAVIVSPDSDVWEITLNCFWLPKYEGKSNDYVRAKMVNTNPPVAKNCVVIDKAISHLL